MLFAMPFTCSIRRLASLAVALLLMASFALLIPDPAAAASACPVCDNLRDLMQGLAKSVFVGIVGVVALVFLLNRRWVDLGLFILAALVVGGFVFDSAGIVTIIKSTWQSLSS